MAFNALSLAAGIGLLHTIQSVLLLIGAFAGVPSIALDELGLIVFFGMI